MTILLRILLIALGVLVLAVFLLALYILLANFLRHPWSKRLCPHALEPQLGELEAMEEKLREMGLEDHFAQSGSHTLHACLLDRGSEKIAVLLHGIGGSARERYLDAQYYLDRGYTLFLPDLRACGLSDGRFYGMGQYEREDLLIWLRLLRARFGEDCPIILDGVSMGASAALLLAGDEPAEGITAVIADCGYAGARDEIVHRLDKAHLPVFPIYPAVRALMRLLAGYDLSRAAPLDAMAGMKTPVLFLHGEADDFVPCAMAYEMYMQCASDKAIYVVPGAGHVASRVLDRPGCEAKMDEFLSPLINR